VIRGTPKATRETRALALPLSVLNVLIATSRYYNMAMNGL